MSKSDITSVLQRDTEFEERAGVKLSALAAFADTNDDDGSVDVVVLGELHSAEGKKIAKDVNLEIAVYDSRGRVIAMTVERFSSDQFWGYQAFEANCSRVPPNTCAAIKIIPRTRP